MIHVFKVYSFSENSAGGNLAGVVPNAEYLSDDMMQSIAKEVGASETVFVLPSQQADIRLRWFTPNTEVGICVHATIAALSVLRQHYHLTAQTLKIEAKFSNLMAEFKGQDIFIQMPPYQKSNDIISLKKILPLLPVEFDQLTQTPAIINVVTDRELVVEVNSFDALQKLMPEQHRYAEICHALNVTGISIFTRETLNKDNHLHTREFAPLYGYLEDPICGMAAGAIATYLAAEQPLRIEQGYFCNTSGLVKVETKRDKAIWVGGAYYILNHDNLFI